MKGIRKNFVLRLCRRMGVTSDEVGNWGRTITGEGNRFLLGRWKSGTEEGREARVCKVKRSYILWEKGKM